MAAPPLDIRATTKKAEFEYEQPTAVIALTSTFTPPSTCFENRLTMLPPASFIWHNEPVPVANNTVAACFPSEFLESYTSVNTTNAGGTTIGSSVVPAMSPFVCPKNYCTVFAEARNYIACCPSSYQFHPPDATVDTNRPAYGGTCYSDLPVGTNVPVVGYDAKGNTGSKAFSSSASGAQAFAHPIDGWALTSPTIIGCPTTSASLTSDSDNGAASSNSQASSQGGAGAGANASNTTGSSGISSGAIAGAVIGGVAGLALLVGLVWFLLKRRHDNNRASGGAHHMGDDFGGSKVYHRFEAPASSTMPQEKAEWEHSQANTGTGVFEMQGMHPVELSAEAPKGGDAKMGSYVR